MPIGVDYLGLASEEEVAPGAFDPKEAAMGFSAWGIIVQLRHRDRGLPLPKAFYRSRRPGDDPTDIVALTVFLKGLIAPESDAPLVESSIDQADRRVLDEGVGVQAAHEGASRQ